MQIILCIDLLFMFFIMFEKVYMLDQITSKIIYAFLLKKRVEKSYAERNLEQTYNIHGKDIQ